MNANQLRKQLEHMPPTAQIFFADHDGEPVRIFHANLHAATKRQDSSSGSRRTVWDVGEGKERAVVLRP